jgi:enamine deaminase RidA (YjgF/YER057c/UK114 family)
MMNEDSKIHNPKSKIVTPPELVAPRGFSHGIVTTGGRLLFLAGQTALDAAGQIVAPGDLVAQYAQVLRNLQAVVTAAGGTMQDITQITIFVRDRDDYIAHLKPLGQVHKAFFGSYYPATALIEISRLFDDAALIEIQGLAVIGADAPGEGG